MALLRTWLLIAVALLVLALVPVFGIWGSNATRQIRRSQDQASQLRADVKRLQQTVDAQEDLIFDAEHVIGEVAPSVVTLFTSSGLGTGFVVKSEDGVSWVATNLHVVSRHQGRLDPEIVVKQGGSEWDGGVERWNEESDLAIVRIQATLPALDLAYGPGGSEPMSATGSWRTDLPWDFRERRPWGSSPPFVPAGCRRTPRSTRGTPVVRLSTEMAESSASRAWVSRAEDLGSGSRSMPGSCVLWSPA